MSLRIDNIFDRRTGEPVAGFFIRNRQNKTIAVGALTFNGAVDFLVITHGRYEHDADLVAKCERMTGLTARHRKEGAA